ncbi:hypothetical protein GCM10023081_45670 [Arthrobacter ginkgonis]|uniref:Uncharacterized protein n=1 Tax=Arthrobacter ginkgonis TaxID=1630594 RepID=A0ABP7DHF3_9MICC
MGTPQDEPLRSARDRRLREIEDRLMAEEAERGRAELIVKLNRQLGRPTDPSIVARAAGEMPPPLRPERQRRFEEIFQELLIEEADRGRAGLIVKLNRRLGRPTDPATIERAQRRPRGGR